MLDFSLKNSIQAKLERENQHIDNSTRENMKLVLCHLKQSLMVASTAALFHICIGL